METYVHRHQKKHLRNRVYAKLTLSCSVPKRDLANHRVLRSFLVPTLPFIGKPPLVLQRGRDARYISAVVVKRIRLLPILQWCEERGLFSDQRSMRNRGRAFFCCLLPKTWRCRPNSSITGMTFDTSGGASSLTSNCRTFSQPSKEAAL